MDMDPFRALIRKLPIRLLAFPPPFQWCFFSSTIQNLPKNFCNSVRDLPSISLIHCCKMLINSQANHHRRNKMANCWFPDEVMMKILSNLPIKSMVRFRCVCKSWFQFFTAQTSDPYFTQLANPNPILIHLQYCDVQQLPYKFCFASDYTKIDNPIELKEPDWYTDEIPYWGEEGVCVDVYGVCNGLVCVKSRRFESHTMYIWNPITRDNIRIPCIPYVADVSDDRTKRVVYGFGFCQATNEYKVVGIVVSSSGRCSEKYDYRCRANVLTLGTNTWRAMEDVLFDVKVRLHKLSSSVVSNGALHWLAYDEDFLFSRKLFSFDLERECFHEIVTPKLLVGDHYLHLEEVSGKLAILYNDSKNDVQIWVMNDYGVQDSWTKEFTITQSQIPVQYFRLEPFGVTNDGSIMMRNNDYLLLLDPKTNSIRTSKFFQFGYPSLSAYCYKWSLVSPRYITSEDSEQERKTCT